MKAGESATREPTTTEVFDRTLASAWHWLNRRDGWFRWVVLAFGTGISTFVMYQTYVVDRHLIGELTLWHRTGIVLFVILWAALIWGGAGVLRHMIAQRRNRKAQQQAEPETISPAEQ